MMSSMKPVLKILIPVLIFTTVLVVLLRATKTIRPHQGPPNTKRRHVLVKGVDFGLNPHAGSTVRETYHGEAPSYRLTYTVDRFNLRPTEKQRGTAEKYVVLGGCSFTFGVGLEDRHTLPTLLQHQLPEYQGYNLGSMGGGLHTVIRHVEHFNPRDYLKEKSGDFIYVFMEDHVRRFLGKYRFIRWAFPTAPHYRVQEGKVTYQGKIGEQTKAKIFSFSRNLGIENYLPYLDDEITDADLEEFAAAVAHLKTIVEEKFPSVKFHFAVHPSLPLVFEKREVLLRMLREHGIRTIDVTEDYHRIVRERNLTLKDLKVVNDPHPSQTVNEIFTQLLAGKLGSEH